MDSSGMEVLCKNTAYGCTFASSSMEDMVIHFQSACTFHPVQCFKCSKMVSKMDFAKHYEQCCKDSSASPCSRPKEAPDVAEANDSATTKSRKRNFPRECVTECTVSVKSVCSGMKVVAAGVAEVKVMEENQQDLKASLKLQADSIKKLGKTIMTTAEKMSEVKDGVKEKVDGLVKEVGVLTRRLADQSKIHWYVENVSHIIQKAKTEQSYVKSDVFVVRGYSARLWFELEEDEGDLCIALHFCLCRGPRDSLLQWPFRIPYTLSLIHPKDLSKTKEDKTTPSFTNPECFEKPKDEENHGFGTDSFCTVEAAQKEGFIENDAVCFGLTLHE